MSSFNDACLWKKLIDYTICSTEHVNHNGIPVTFVIAKRRTDIACDFSSMCEQGQEMFLITANGETNYLGSYLFYLLKGLLSQQQGSQEPILDVTSSSNEPQPPLKKRNLNSSTKKTLII